MFGKTEKTEKQFDTEIALAFNKGGTRLFKNVVGQLWAGKLLSHTAGIARIANAVRIKCGIGGTGGSDRIGFHQIKITPEMVGKSVAVFTAVELKTIKGVVSTEQQNFVEFISASGGIAGVARSVEDVQNLFDSYTTKLQS